MKDASSSDNDLMSVMADVNAESSFARVWLRLSHNVAFSPHFDESSAKKV
jgi:hypothetical protein